jgi:hypothetical protein
MTTEQANISPYVLYYGRDEPPPERLTLRAGPLSLEYENGDLRYIRLRDREIVRRLYVAVRDHNWNTAPMTLSRVTIQRHERSFEISYEAHHRLDDIEFTWQGHITGDEAGTITFSMDGQALSTFLRNRIGFCVLHPMAECAGAPCVVEHVDGSRTESTFPKAISPHQPFFDIRSISHRVTPDVWATMAFQGDTFEMEDQRNWTDASFKTYSTPLGLPFPVRIEQGTRISQTLTLTLQGQVDHGVPIDEPLGIQVLIGSEPAAPLPGVGLGLPSHGRPSTALEVERLRALHPAHLRLDLRLSEPYEDALEWGIREAAQIGVPLEIALTVSDKAADELCALREALSRHLPPVCRWLVFHALEKSTSPHWVDMARHHLETYSDALFAIGTNSYFTELNRGRPGTHNADVMCYSLNPQVHAFDDASLVETLEAQAVTIDSAREIAGSCPLVITPVTLRPRFNPNATTAERDSGTELPSAVDVRQASLLAAGWTAGSIKYISRIGVLAATYYETTGWRGVMEREEGSPLPDLFPSMPGAVFPLYHVLALVGEFAGGHVVDTVSSAPLRIDGLTLDKAGRRRTILAALGPSTEMVTVRHLAARVAMRTLDETNAVSAMSDPEAFRAEQAIMMDTDQGVLEIELKPYAVVWLDYTP